MSASPPTADLFRTERMRRRRIVNAVVEVAATVAALLAVAVLVLVVGSVVSKGWKAIKRQSAKRRGSLRLSSRQPRQ